MSVRTTSQVWDFSQADGNRLLVMLALADHCDDEGICWPGQAGIAAKTRLGERTVRRIIGQLASAGELTQHHRKGTSSVFQLHPGQNGRTQQPGQNGRTTPATVGRTTPATAVAYESSGESPVEPDPPTNEKPSRKTREVTPDLKKIRPPKEPKPGLGRLPRQAQPAPDRTPYPVRKTRAERIAESDAETIRQLKGAGL